MTRLDRGGTLILCSRCSTRLGSVWPPSPGMDQWRYRVQADIRRKELKFKDAPDERVGVYCPGCRQVGELVPTNLVARLAERPSYIRMRVAYRDAPPRS